MNIKSEKGFTLQDLLIAIVIIGIFTGVTSSVMISWYNLSLETVVTGNATYYAIKIMEKVDRENFDEVTEENIITWLNEISVPSVYNISVEVGNYSEDGIVLQNVKEIKLTISYTLGNSEEKLVMNKLKIQETNL